MKPSETNLETKNPLLHAEIAHDGGAAHCARAGPLPLRKHPGKHTVIIGSAMVIQIAYRRKLIHRREQVPSTLAAPVPAPLARPRCSDVLLWRGYDAAQAKEWQRHSKSKLPPHLVDVSSARPSPHTSRHRAAPHRTTAHHTTRAPPHRTAPHHMAGCMHAFRMTTEHVLPRCAAEHD